MGLIAPCDPFGNELEAPLRPGDRHLTDFRLRCPENDARELVKDFVIMQGTLNLLAGPTGVGKSVLNYQQTVGFALGMCVLGLRPARPLRSVIFQSENEEYDIARAREGVFEHMKLTHEQQLLVGKRVILVPYRDRQGLNWLRTDVEPALAHYKPDLWYIDPVLEFYEGDINEAAAVKRFLRHMLRPLCRAYPSAVMLCHHTPKPPQSSRAKWKNNEHAYRGAGSIEWVNPCRTAMSLEATDSPKTFWYRITKKWQEAGWVDEAGNPTDCKLIRYASNCLCWEEVVEEVHGLYEPGPEDVLRLLPGDARMEKTRLVEALQVRGIARNTARKLVDSMLQSGELCAVKEAHGKGHPRLLICRCSAVENTPSA